jgi:heat shock protein HslJ
MKTLFICFCITLATISCNRSKTQSSGTPTNTTTPNTNVTTTTSTTEYVNPSNLNTDTTKDDNTDLCKLPWKLTNLNDKTVPGNNTVTFNKDGSFVAKICNSMNGNYKIKDNGTIQINVTTSTKMMCHEVLGEAEMFFKSGQFEIDITKGYLNLVKADKYLLFERATTSKENRMAN